jgi:hypothetical protein
VPVAVHTPSPAITSDDTNINGNFRTFVKLSANSNGQIRVRYKAGSTNGMQIRGAAIGKWDGATLSSVGCDMTTTPFRLLFSGANSSSSVAANATITSDFVTHTGLTLNANDWLIVTFFGGSTTGTSGEAFSSGHTDATCLFNISATDMSQDQLGSTHGSWSLIGPTQPGSAGGTNYGVDLVETNDPAASFLPDPRPARAIPIMAQ